MRITTLDLKTHKRCGIEIPLQRLAASPKPSEAAYWRKLLELVEHLQANGPEPELWARIKFQEVELSKPAAPDSVRMREMNAFMDEWRQPNPDPGTWGKSVRREMEQRFPHKPRTTVSVWVDWRDYPPLREGVPEMHFRFQVKRPGKTLSEDARAKDPLEAERIICEVFG